MDPCSKCGEVHQRDGKPTCTGHRRDGHFCTKYPVHGATVCGTHGGRAPQVKAKAKERVAIEAARTALRRVEHLGDFTPDEVVTPAAEMIALVREAKGALNFWRQMVGDLPSHPAPGTWETTDEGKPYFRQGDPGVYGPTYHQSGIPTGEGKPHVLVVMYNDALDRHQKFLKEALAAGIEERRLQLQEGDAQTLMAGVAQAIQAANLTPQQAEEFRRAFADHLRTQDAPRLPR